MTTTVESPNPTIPADGEIIARAGRYYRNARYLMVVGCLVLAAFFAYDGFIRWPKEQQEAARITAAGGTPKTKPHSDFDITLQIRLAGGLPVLAAGVLFWLLYNSRGEYRLAGNTLYVPGHPPVPLENIRQIDESRFDRKGIVYIDYDVPGSSSTGRLKLDDFVYDQTATDAIFKQIKATILPETAQVADASQGLEQATPVPPENSETSGQA